MPTPRKRKHFGKRGKKPMQAVPKPGARKRIPKYEPLTVETLANRLVHIPALAGKLGRKTDAWRVREVGDGNLNLVFIVESPKSSLIVKQALPYVRLVGKSWPLPLKRSYFEYHALSRQARHDRGRVPRILHFDEMQALIAMEYLRPHVILRRSLMAGVEHLKLGEQLGLFLARTLFRSSDLSLPTATRKADLALFAGNIELCDITEALVFTDPFYPARLNRHTSPQLDEMVARVRADIDLKVMAQHLKSAFCSNAEALLHGDLHTGSVMAHGADARVIDPEFAVYGPMGFDIGMLIGNFLMAYFAQKGHEKKSGERKSYREWILNVTQTVWDTFVAEFSHLWRTERRGILYPAVLYEDQGHGLAAEQALSARLQRIWQDMLGFAGIEMHRRILGLAHVAEFEKIENPALRAKCETKALLLGRYLAVNCQQICSMGEVLATARRIEEGRCA